MTGRVLVVDDEPIIRRFLAEGLTDAGYQVLIARDRAEALDSAYRFHPAAVLLDLLMPGRLGVHSVEETLGSVALHRLWQDAVRCNYPSCPRGD